MLKGSTGMCGVSGRVVIKNIINKEIINFSKRVTIVGIGKYTVEPSPLATY
jgi:hypothetical protein